MTMNASLALLLCSFVFRVAGWTQTPAPAKLDVDALHASAATLQNTLVEMSGVRRVESTEVSEGLYELTFWGREDAPACKAILPFKWAVLAQRSRVLFVSVKDPKQNPPRLTIFGNEIRAGDPFESTKVTWEDPR